MDRALLFSTGVRRSGIRRRFLFAGLLLGCCPGAAAAQVAEAEEDDHREPAAVYPTAYIERPLTLPALMAQASVSSGYWWVEDEENVSTTRVVGALGLTDWWQMSATTRWFVAPEREWDEVITVASRVQALDTKRVAIAPGVTLAMRFDGDRDTEAVPAVTVDALARIRVLKRSALYVGDGLLTVGFGDAATGLDVNVALIQQAGDRLAVRISSQLVHIRLDGDGRESGGPYWFDLGVIASPARWIDFSLGIQLQSASNGIIGRVAGRL